MYPLTVGYMRPATPEDEPENFSFRVTTPDGAVLEEVRREESRWVGRTLVTHRVTYPVLSPTRRAALAAIGDRLADGAYDDPAEAIHVARVELEAWEMGLP